MSRFWKIPRAAHLTRSATLGIALAAAVAVAPSVEAEPTKGGEFTYLSSPIPSLNPLHAQFDVGLVSSQIFASLVRFDENNEPAPYLAKSYEISEDGLTYTFNLHENARFHDGEPITSQDVAFSLGVVRENHRFADQMFGPIETIEIPDDHTVVLKLSKPHGPLLVSMTTPRQLPIMPEHVYAGEDFMTLEAHKNPVGSGPFILTEYVTDQYVIVERNPDHFIAELPYVDRITYRMVAEKTAKRIGLRQNQFHLATAAAVMRLSDIDSFLEIDHLRLTTLETPSGGAIVLEFNNREGPLADQKVRQAIAYAIDTDFLSNVLHSGYSTPSVGPLPRTNIFFDDSVEGYGHDVDKANALLDEAGYTRDGDGTRFELGLIYIAQPFWPDYQQVPGEYIAQKLKDVGIQVNQEPMAGAAAWSQRISAWDYDMSLNWPGDKVDPAIGVSRLYVCDNIRNQAYTNTSGYCREEVDEIFEKAALESDPATRKALYTEVQEMLIEDIPMYWLFDTRSNWFHHKDLHVPTYGFGEAWDLIYWQTPQG